MRLVILALGFLAVLASCTQVQVPVVHPRMTHAILVAPQVQRCTNCSIDLRATFVDRVIRDGRMLWRYSTARGMFLMTVERRGSADMIRLAPDGRVIGWVSARP